MSAWLTPVGTNVPNSELNAWCGLISGGSAVGFVPFMRYEMMSRPYAAETERYQSACTRYCSDLKVVVPAIRSAMTWSDVAPSERVREAFERTPDSSGDSEFTWCASGRPPAGTVPPFSAAHGIFNPETMLTSLFSAASGCVAVFRS